MQRRGMDKACRAHLAPPLGADAQATTTRDTQRNRGELGVTSLVFKARTSSVKPQGRRFVFIRTLRLHAGRPWDNRSGLGFLVAFTILSIKTARTRDLRPEHTCES